ncbi:MAG: BON domain-containing protein [Gammaproteobacteria bacterium]
MNHRIALFSLAVVSTASLSACIPLIAAGAATGVAVAHDQRSAGAVIDDQAIELKAIGALKGETQLYSESHLNVTSYNGIVLVTGEAPTQELRDRVTNIVRGIDKVRTVHNEVAIAAPSSLMARSSDTVLTGKVKARLIGERGFDSSRVKVVSEGGVVYLMGIVTRNEAEVATEIARTTDGVQRVVRLFEYAENQ